MAALEQRMTALNVTPSASAGAAGTAAAVAGAGAPASRRAQPPALASGKPLSRAALASQVLRVALGFLGCRSREGRCGSRAGRGSELGRDAEERVSRSRATPPGTRVEAV